MEKEMEKKMGTILEWCDKVPSAVRKALGRQVDFVECDEVGIFDRGVYLLAETLYEDADAEVPTTHVQLKGFEIAERILKDGFRGSVLMGSVLPKEKLLEKGAELLSHPQVFYFDLLTPVIPHTFWENHYPAPTAVNLEPKDGVYCLICRQSHPDNGYNTWVRWKGSVGYEGVCDQSLGEMIDILGRMDPSDLANLIAEVAQNATTVENREWWKRELPTAYVERIHEAFRKIRRIGFRAKQ
jgi:hypothetical protein